MANKSTGKNYTSKGERRSSMSTRGGVTSAQKMNNKMDALARGKRIVVTIANPDKNDTARPFVRMMYDAKSPRGTIISPNNSRGVQL